MKRFPFLDWTRGLAVVIMIECHTFNSFARMDLREGGPYVLSQFVGGMAAVLFLFMAGMTLAFQMDSLDRKEPVPLRRLLACMRRGGYILGIAYLFRLSNWAGGLPHSSWREIVKVDILNCMGVSAVALSLASLAPRKARAQAAAVAGVALASVSPLISGMDWSGVPVLLRDYVVPDPGHFPFFPWCAYLAFGVAAGAALKQSPPERLERLMQWAALVGFGLVFTAQYFSNIPFSLYTNSRFWVDSPSLVLIRTGICLVMLAGAYVWTEFCSGPGWSWLESLGKTSLLAYWVHVVIVYGSVLKPLERALSIPATTAATAVLIVLMVALSAAKLRWQGWRAEKRNAGTKAAVAAG